MIDLVFGDPFSPYELKFEPKDFDNAYLAVASGLGYEESQARSILTTKKEALEAHDERSLWKIIVAGGAAALVCAVGGYVFAPYVAGFLAGGAGLAGAAATSYGLALLGGGSLAMGGLGMAGGLWIVTGVAAAAGGGLMTGGQLLYSLGVGQARVELIKLQVTYKEVLLQNQIETAKSKEVIKKLYEDQREIEKDLAEEKLLNESTSERVKDVEKKLKSIHASLEWMKKAAA